MLSRDPELREYIHRISTHFVSLLWKQTSQQVVGLCIDKRGGLRYFCPYSFGKYDQASHPMQFSIENRKLFRHWLGFALLRFLVIGWKFESYQFLNQSKTIVNSSDYALGTKISMFSNRVSLSDFCAHSDFHPRKQLTHPGKWHEA